MSAPCRFAAAPHGRAAVLLAVAGVLGAGSVADAGPPAKKAPLPESASATRPPSPVVPRSNVLTAEPWQNASFAPLTPAELDRLVTAEQREDKIKPAARTSDEAFLR